ncbi:hypothetical protein EOM71_01895 [Candidatus Falkowbacteria bacterium]|nr:hypothetical protein [Candidatus Falkowbacteria bacterium]
MENFGLHTKIEQLAVFNSSHSALEKNEKQKKEYVRLLKEALGHNCEIIGILEIGSYAKGEAVPNSDNDTKVYVSSPDCYVWQSSGSRFNNSQAQAREVKYNEFIQHQLQAKPRLDLDWFEFNEPLITKINKELGSNIELGFADFDYAEYELANLEISPSEEHSMLLSSNIIYDPQFKLAAMVEQISGRIYPSMVNFYQQRYLNQLPFEVYEHLQPHKFDHKKLEQSGQISWVKWAANAIRGAVAAKSYQASGNYIYKKDDILAFLSRYLPDEVELAQVIYSWKTDPIIRQQIVTQYLSDQDKLFSQAQELTKKLEVMVSKIDKLSLNEIS